MLTERHILTVKCEASGQTIHEQWMICCAVQCSITAIIFFDGEHVPLCLLYRQTDFLPSLGVASSGIGRYPPCLLNFSLSRGFPKAFTQACALLVI